MISARFHDLGGRSAYQVLGVFETAGPEEVNKAYRRCMRELHPDLGSGQGNEQEAQHVSIAHRWLTRHRSEYERFVFDRRRDDPQWGRVLAPVVHDVPPRTSSGTGSFRTVAQERMAERAAEWAERQQRDGRGSRDGWRAPRVAAAWGDSAEPTDDFGGDGAQGVRWSRAEERRQWDGGGEARSVWASGPPTAEQTLLDASRDGVARRREERLRADAARRRATGAASPVADAASPAAGAGASPFTDTASPAEGASSAGGEATAPVTDAATSPVMGEASSPITGADGTRAGADFSFGRQPGRTNAAVRSSRWRKRFGLPRLGLSALTRLPRLGFPSAPRLGLPPLPKVGVPRLGVKVFPRRRRSPGVRVESLVLAALVLVLGLLVAARIPF